MLEKGNTPMPAIEPVNTMVPLALITNWASSRHMLA